MNHIIQLWISSIGVRTFLPQMDRVLSNRRRSRVLPFFKNQPSSSHCIAAIGVAALLHFYGMQGEKASRAL